VANDIDPLESHRKDRQGETVKVLCAAYIERDTKPHKRTWGQNQRRIDKHILAAWGNRRANSITSTDVAALHAR
jgi:hypothetical protein